MGTGGLSEPEPYAMETEIDPHPSEPVQPCGAQVAGEVLPLVSNQPTGVAPPSSPRTDPTQPEDDTTTHPVADDGTNKVAPPLALAKDTASDRSQQYNDVMARTNLYYHIVYE